MKRAIVILAVAVGLAATLGLGVLVGTLAGNIVWAQNPGPGVGGWGMMGRGPGMMEWWGAAPGSQGITGTAPYGGGYGPGWMMGGRGGMMGRFGWGTSGNQSPITLSQAEEAARAYLARYNNADLALAEVMEFDNNCYFVVNEKSTGRGAFEFLVDRTSGWAHPEPGPNMMWNDKYGHMGGMMGGWWRGQTAPGSSALTMAQARDAAAAYLAKAMPGATPHENGDHFYGYYTFDVDKGGAVIGMLSVDENSGQVWYHTWHGAFVQEKEYE